MVKPELFKRTGILFIPKNIIGWLVAASAAAYCVYLFIDIDSMSHSVSDTLMNFVFNALIVGVIYSIIAYFFSKEK